MGIKDAVELLGEIITDAESTASDSKEVGSYQSPCDSNIKPIYPVRYAYANFFSENLSTATVEPTITQLLKANSIADGDGYIARLLRPGWIYIKDEDYDDFHIFQYQPTEIMVDGAKKRVERYRKFVFKNGINAQGGLTPDKGARGEGYHFLFVAKRATNISIIYSEHEWHADIIDKMNGNKDIRTKVMQQVNLEQTETNVSVEASEENFTRLIEDYKQRQQRFLALNANMASTRISQSDVSLDILTTQDAYQMEADSIAKEIRSKLCYGETARIVILFDPVGKQKEIIQAHNILIEWQQQFLAKNTYPMTIGGFIEQLKTSENEEIKEALSNAIHSKNWQVYESDIKQEQQAFNDRLKVFAELYRAFMCDKSVNGRIGSLDTYIKYLFTSSVDDKKRSEEYTKLCELLAKLFEGVCDSLAGKEALEKIINDAADSERSFNDETNVYKLGFDIFKGIVTQPQGHFVWSEANLLALNKLFKGVNIVWGEAVATAKYSASTGRRALNILTLKSLDYVSKNTVPWLMDVWGVKISENSKVTLTPNELARMLSKMLNENAQRFSKGQPLSYKAIEQAEAKMAGAQKLFDWFSRKSDAGRSKLLLEIPEGEIVRVSGERFRFAETESGTRKVALLFDSAFSGLSAFFNIVTLVSLTNQASHYQKQNPLDYGNMTYTLIKASAAIMSLTIDLMNVGRSVAAYSPKIIPTAIASKLAPLLGKSARGLEKILAHGAIKGVLGVVNLLSAIVSVLDAKTAYQQGNTGEMISHGLLATGAAIFAGLAFASLAGLSAPLWVTVLAFSLVVAGIVGLFYTSRTPLENVLYNCFWGNGTQYGFWNKQRFNIETLREESDLTLPDREHVKHYYQVEVQEFMNLLLMPALEIEGKSAWLGRMGEGELYHYHFSLPGFQSGLSELSYRIYTISEFREDGMVDKMPNQLLEQQFSDAVKHAEMLIQDGICQVKVPMNANQMRHATLIWYYQPSDEIIVPLRYLASNGKVSSEATVGMINGEPR